MVERDSPLSWSNSGTKGPRGRAEAHDRTVRAYAPFMLMAGIPPSSITIGDEDDMKLFLSVLFAIGLFGVAPLAQAQGEVTVSNEESIPPLVWELITFEDPLRGADQVDDPSRYTIQLLPDGTLFLQADCNTGSGSYSIGGSSIEFSEFVTTLILCPEDSQDARFLEELSHVTSYVIDREDLNDELVLALMADGGFLRFAPALTGVVWEWQQFEGGDGSLVVPDNPSAYTIQFFEDGSVQVDSDCNAGSGSYTTENGSLSMTIAFTEAYCGDDSFDQEFTRYLSEAVSFVIQDGKLALSLPVDAGIATFAPVVEPLTDATPELEG
jgi:heat shock protein HslJ